MIKYDSPHEKIILFAAPGKSFNDTSSMKFTHRLARNLSIEYANIHYFNVITTKSLYTFLKQVFLLRKFIKSSNPDLVVSHWGGFCGLTVLIASFGFKRIITFHGPDLNWDLSRSTVSNFLVILISKICSVFYDQVISVSAELSTIQYNKNSSVIPMPIDIDHFSPKNKTELRESLGINHLNNIVVFICGNDPIGKGIELALKVQQIALRHKYYDLLIFDKMISYDDMPKYISMANCLLFLSYKEGSPNLVREACACNIPVVSVDVGDVVSVLNKFDSCFIVNRNPEIIDKAILQALKYHNINIRDEICKLNRNYFEKIISIYEDSIGV